MNTASKLLNQLVKLMLVVCLVICFGICHHPPVTNYSLVLPTTNIDTVYLRNVLLGNVDYAHDSNFVRVDPKYAYRSIYLERNTYNAFVDMHNAAAADGVDLKILSGARSFEYQKRIWEHKWALSKDNQPDIQKATDILRYSAMPGTSRHHWGTDIDINSLSNAYFERGRGLKEYTWLLENAGRFGFCQVYTSKENTNRTGYEMERWHWSYLPVAAAYTNHYARMIGYKDLVGFSGSHVAPDLQVVERYVLGVAECNFPLLLK
ncbi:M15 family metallopeptidase [Perlabentimonas gracilis]|uniref:M15 family metallopeptidase n=1 Tax=Perlabentimonas gracilis TaxID=2715279 RepID=UPI00140A2E6E|nr:M15 family metallopeptidase [Perlabentimonas gracilis]NHB68331.1 M15 family metallopeptidase [Perlabentimonas gracilis]